MESSIVIAGFGGQGVLLPEKCWLMPGWKTVARDLDSVLWSGNAWRNGELYGRDQ